MTCIETISLILSLLALMLSLVTFWYVSLRKGKVTVENPVSFKSFGSPGKKERIPIRLPLVISNTGSKTKILSRLSLVEKDNARIFNYSAFLDDVTKLDEDKRSPPKPIILPSFSSTLVYIEFQSDEIVFEFTDKPVEFILQSKINSSKKEVIIGNLRLQVPSELIKQINQEMIMVENTSHKKGDM